MKKVKMELIDKGFTQKIADKYTTLQLFSTNFAPIISTKRIIPRMKWLELVYAMPYVVLRREIFNSFKKTKNVLASVKQIWNIFVHLEFPLSRYKYITTRLHRFSREIVTMQDTGYKMQVKHVSGTLYPVSSPSVDLVKSRDFYFESSSMELAQSASYETSKRETKKESPVTNYRLPVVNYNPPVVSHKPSDLNYEDQANYILRSTSGITTPLFTYYSSKPAFFLSQKTVPVKEQEASLIAQKSDAVYRPYGHLERGTLGSGQKMFSYFNFKSSSMELAQPVSHENTGIETEKESAFANYQLPVVTHQPPVVRHKPPAVRYEDLVTYILTSTSDITTPLFSYYSFNPTLFLSQKTVPIMQRGVSLIAQKSDAPYRPYRDLDRETMQNGQRIISNSKSSSMELAQPVSPETTGLETEKESAFANYQLPVVTHQPPVVSHKPPAVRYEDQATYIPTSTSDLITPLFSYYSAQKIKTGVGEKAIYDILPYFNFRSNKQMHTSEVEKAPIYHTYPEIEHVTSTHTEVIKERVIEKEEESEPPHATPQLPGIDVNRLADQVYSVIERKIRIEKERRGLYG